jgi:hypothetical protein
MIDGAHHLPIIKQVDALAADPASASRPRNMREPAKGKQTQLVEAPHDC